VKTSELVRKIKASGCRLVEHGREHDKWFSPVTGKFFRVSRHTSKEIANGTAYAILRDAGVK
jgi:predicted RNA binding protein YcfA (HicA-like mRNA interferase family)